MGAAFGSLLAGLEPWWEGGEPDCFCWGDGAGDLTESGRMVFQLPLGSLSLALIRRRPTVLV